MRSWSSPGWTALRLVSAVLAGGLLVLAPAGAGRTTSAFPAAVARADDDWFAEFEAVCSKTQDAMSLTTDELRGLIGRCERLKPRIEGLDPSRRKVYASRLQRCRDLYQFVLDTRGGK